MHKPLIVINANYLHGEQLTICEYDYKIHLKKHNWIQIEQFH